MLVRYDAYCLQRGLVSLGQLPRGPGVGEGMQCHQWFLQV